MAEDLPTFTMPVNGVRNLLETLVGGSGKRGAGAGWSGLCGRFGPQGLFIKIIVTETRYFTKCGHGLGTV